jgi:hypothetical protein
MDRVEKSEVTLSGRLIGNLSATGFLNTQDIRPFETQFVSLGEQSSVNVSLNDIALTEAGLMLRWAPGEKLVRTSKGEVRLGGKYPVTHFRITQGVDGLLDGATAFTRYDAMIEKPFRFVHLGTLNVRISGGLIPGDLPPSLLYNMRGTNNLNYAEGPYIGLVSANSFETMRTNEFMVSRYAALHIRHEFRDLLFKSENFRPYITLVHNMLIGERDGNTDFLIAARESERPFIESGIVLDRLFVSGISALGVGFFYRYGDHAFDGTRDNFIGKISGSFAF